MLYLRCRKLTLFAKRRTMLNLAGLGWAERKVGPLCKEMRGGKIDSKSFLKNVWNLSFSAHRNLL
jgi:hypothetical protein